jgi:hypothetical protein
MTVMTDNQVNPYESPQPVTAKPGSGVGNATVRAMLRIFVVVLIGYVAFTSVGLLYLVAAEYFQWDIFPSVQWALTIGGFGALIFLGSEIFNSGAGRQAGFLRRFIVAIGTIFVGGIISSAISTAVGWNPPHYRSQESDPYWIHNLFLFGVFSTTILLAVRSLWIAGPRVGENRP